MMSLICAMLIGQCSGGVCAVPPTFANLSPVPSMQSFGSYQSRVVTSTPMTSYGQEVVLRMNAPPSSIRVEVVQDHAVMPMSRFKFKSVVKSRGRLFGGFCR